MGKKTRTPADRVSDSSPPRAPAASHHPRRAAYTELTSSSKYSPSDSTPENTNDVGKSSRYLADRTASRSSSSRRTSRYNTTQASARAAFDIMTPARNGSPTRRPSIRMRSGYSGKKL